MECSIWRRLRIRDSSVNRCGKHAQCDQILTGDMSMLRHYANDAWLLVQGEILTRNSFREAAETRLSTYPKAESW